MLGWLLRVPSKRQSYLQQQLRGAKRTPRSLSVLLTQDVPDLGLAGTEVSVSPGFARNNLIPRRAAVPSTALNKTKYHDPSQEIKAAEISKLAAEDNDQMQLAAVLKKLLRTPLVMRQKVEEEGSQALQQPVTGQMICEAVARQMSIQLPEALLDLPGPIVEHGEYHVSLRILLGQGARARMMVNVLPSS